MRIKSIVEEDFIQYKKPSMFIITSFCNWKCCKELNLDISICQNAPLVNRPIMKLEDSEIISRYLSNPITQAIVFGGLEPFDQFEELKQFISEFRKVSSDDIVIYTGFYKEEIIDKIEQLKPFKNIIVKFGRYIPNQASHYDDVLGVTLASPNQKGELICE